MNADPKLSALREMMKFLIEAGNKTHAALELAESTGIHELTESQLRDAKLEIYDVIYEINKKILDRDVWI